MIWYNNLQRGRAGSDLVLWFAKIENMAERSSSASLQIGVKHFGNHGTKVINHCDLDVELNFS